MSGTAFLEEIVTWDDEKRAERQEEALPRLILCLENYKSYDEAVGILQIVCQCFVPVVQPEQVEHRVFRPLSHQICQLLDSVVEEVHEAMREDQDIDTDLLVTLLQPVVNVAQCVEECVKHMATKAELHIDHVRSLVVCSFHVLKGSYSHCQESGSLYGDLLPAVSDTLSLIFRTAHSLQMVLLNLLDKLVSPQPLSNQGLQDLALVCGQLYAVCRVVACLDLKLTISLWKALSKLAGPQAGALHGLLDLSGMVTYLCEQILTGVSRLQHSAPPALPQHHQSLCEGEEKVQQKAVRIVGFQLKVLVAFVRDFHPHLTGSLTSLRRIMLAGNRVLAGRALGARRESRQEAELSQQLCQAVQSLLPPLVTNAAFLHCALNTQDKEAGTEVASLQLLIMVMDAVSQTSGDVLSMWLGVSWPSSSRLDDPSDRNLMLAVFSALDTCHAEVCLPVYLPASPCEGKPNRTVSLYQYVVEHVSAFIASCPADLFHIIERSLLQVLLGSNPISSQAAADCWCFLARYGPAELCWQHTQQILGLVLHVREGAPHCLSSTPLTSLLARLAQCLTPQHQRQLVTALAQDPHRLWVWGEVGVGGLSSAVNPDLCQSLVPPCLTTLHSPSPSPAPNTNTAAPAPAFHEISAMRCLNAVLRGDSGAEWLSSPQGLAGVVEIVTSLWHTSLPMSASLLCSSDCTMRQAYLSALLTLTSHLVQHLDVALILQILVLAHKITKDSTSRKLTLAVLQLMQSLGRLKCPPCVEGQILGKINDTFAATLTHPSAIVQFIALEAFSRFAEQTPYESVVVECLSRHDGLQEKVAAYLNKTGEAWNDLRPQQQQVPCDSGPHPHTALPPGPPPSSEPQPKRQKVHDSSRNTQESPTFYQTVLEELERLTEKLENVGREGPLPDWAQGRGKSLLQRLSACFSIEDCSAGIQQ